MPRPAYVLDGLRPSFGRHAGALGGTGATAGGPRSAVEPGPVIARKNAFARARLTKQPVDMIWLNELASSAGRAPPPAIPCIDPIGLDPDRGKVHGGAIAWGVPLGASGTRLVLTMMIELEQSRDHSGLTSMCVGVGQGFAEVLERA